MEEKGASRSCMATPSVMSGMTTRNSVPTTFRHDAGSGRTENLPCRTPMRPTSRNEPGRHERDGSRPQPASHLTQHRAALTSQRFCAIEC